MKILLIFFLTSNAMAGIGDICAHYPSLSVEESCFKACIKKKTCHYVCDQGAGACGHMVCLQTKNASGCYSWDEKKKEIIKQ